MSSTNTENRKDKRPLLQVVLSFMLVLLTIFCMFGLSFRVVLIPQATLLIADQTVNDELSAFTHDDLVDVAKSGRDFVDCEVGATMPEGSDERTAFTPDVVSHMEDVRSVIRVAAIVTFALCVFGVLCAILIWRFFGRQILGKALMIGAVLALVLVLIFAVVGLLSFDVLFSGMHELLFADGTWTFSADSLLITAYPIEFWISMAVVWAAALVVLCAICFAVGWLLKRKRGRTRQA